VPGAGSLTMHNSFEPEEMALFAKVVNDACLKLGSDDAQREIVAAHVMSWASKGPRDYHTLFAIAVFARDAFVYDKDARA
jgi:hypothetical protein